MPATARELRLDADAAMLAWARGIARGVCNDVLKNAGDVRFGFGSDARREVEGTALVVLAKLLHRYDEGRLPAGMDIQVHFRRINGKWIRCECRREVDRIRKGGLHRAPAAGVLVVPLPQSADGEDEVEDPFGEIEDDDDPPDATLSPFGAVSVVRASVDPGDTRARFAELRKKLKGGTR